MARLIRVFEHEKLTTQSLCSERRPVGQKVIEKLWQFNDAHGNIYFEGVRNGVKFKNYVGVVQIGNITIEILPKADKKSSSETEKNQWHDALLLMLKRCKKIKLASVSEASLKKRYHSLLDLYFEIYIQEVTQLLNRGLIKKYRRTSGNILALKGQINFAKNIQKNLVHKERFYTTHETYDYEHLINQILLRALTVLKLISTNTSLIDSLERLKAKFPDIEEVEITSSDFSKIFLNRKASKYEEAIKIAKMILLNFSPDIKGGGENMLALLFDMNKLWEEYVYRMLRKVDEEGLKVSFQNRDKFWEDKYIKPDLVVEKTNEKGIEETYIIDTKWKIIDSDNPGDDDLKQMFVYNLYWRTRKSMLLYPSSNPVKTSFGKFHKGRKKGHSCKLGFINVLEKGQLDLEIGEKIITLLEENPN